MSARRLTGHALADHLERQANRPLQPRRAYVRWLASRVRKMAEAEERENRRRAA